MTMEAETIEMLSRLPDEAKQEFLDYLHALKDEDNEPPKTSPPESETIEKMKRYIDRTKIENADRYGIVLLEVQALIGMLSGDKFAAITLAFNYGMAKGYRAAKRCRSGGHIGRENRRSRKPKAGSLTPAPLKITE